MDKLSDLLGLAVDPKELTFFQISLRGIIVFLVALVMVRLADRRFLSKKTAFDAILGFILASMLARAVNGSASFFATLGGGFVLVGLHRLLAKIAYHSHFFGCLVKGRPAVLISDGVMQGEGMAQNDISEHDLKEDLRLNAQIDNIADVACARLERSGDISAIRRTGGK